MLKKNISFLTIFLSCPEKLAPWLATWLANQLAPCVFEIFNRIVIKSYMFDIILINEHCLQHQPLIDLTLTGPQFVGTRTSRTN